MLLLLYSFEGKLMERFRGEIDLKEDSNLSCHRAVTDLVEIQKKSLKTSSAQRIHTSRSTVGEFVTIFFCLLA